MIDESGGDYVIWGSSGHAKVVSDIITGNGGKILALFDNDSGSKSALAGVPLLIGEKGLVEWVSRYQNPIMPHAVVAIGGGRGDARLGILKMMDSFGFDLETIIHPTASVSPHAKIGKGVQILAQSVVASGASIGDGCILNHRSGVDHETILGDGCHIAPGATLCGCVELGKNVFIGAGSIILPRIKIGDNSVVGAGSVVTKNLPESVIAFGNPCEVRSRSEKYE